MRAFHIHSVPYILIGILFISSLSLHYSYMNRAMTTIASNRVANLARDLIKIDSVI